MKPQLATPSEPIWQTGNSRRLIRSIVEYADEINVYADEEIIRFARQDIEASQRTIAKMLFVK